KQRNVCRSYSRFLRTRVDLAIDFGSKVVALADRNRQEVVAATFCCRVFGKGYGIFLADCSIFALALKRTVLDQLWIAHYFDSCALRRETQASAGHREHQSI